MIKQEIRDKFDIPQHAVLFALIYRAAVELYGRQGAQRADNGTKVYGYQRGMRMAPAFPHVPTTVVASMARSFRISIRISKLYTHVRKEARVSIDPRWCAIARVITSMVNYRT